MKLALLCALMLICASARAVKPLKVAVYAAAEFDAATSYDAIAFNGMAEGDPLLKPFAGNPSIFVVEAFSAWAINHAADKLEVHHRKWAAAVRWAGIGAHGAAGFHNIILVRSR